MIETTREEIGEGVWEHRGRYLFHYSSWCVCGGGWGVVRVSVPEEMTCKPRSESLGPLMGSSGVGTHGDG